MDHKKLTIQPFQAHKLGPYSNQLQFKVRSSVQIDIWVVPSQKDAEMVMEGGNFNYDSRMSKQRTTDHSVSGSVSSQTWIVIANRGNTPATLEIWLS